MNKSVLIFGAFNPVTNAHINMGICCKMVYPSANIVFVPSNDKFLKDWKKYGDGMVLDGDKRFLLLHEAVKKFGFHVSNIEINGTVDGKTYNTIQYYRKMDPIICIGADKLFEIHRWYKAEEVVRDNRFLVITRNNDNGKLHESLMQYNGNFRYIEGPYQEVSSTQIREAYVNNQLGSVKDYVPECVFEYLENTDNVYRKSGF